MAWDFPEEGGHFPEQWVCNRAKSPQWETRQKGEHDNCHGGSTVAGSHGSVTIGGHTVSNVLCTIGGSNDPLLLGQTVLRKFKSWSVDNQHHVLYVNDTASAPPPLLAPAPGYTVPAAAQAPIYTSVAAPAAVPAMVPVVASAAVPTKVPPAAPDARRDPAADVTRPAGSLNDPGVCRGSRGAVGLGGVVSCTVRQLPFGRGVLGSRPKQSPSRALRGGQQRPDICESEGAARRTDRAHLTP